MKKCLSIFLALCMVLSTFSATLTAFAATDTPETLENYNIVNGDFEQSRTVNKDSYGDIKIDDTDVYDGDYSMHIESFSYAENCYQARPRFTVDMSEVRPDALYKLRFKAKGNSGASINTMNLGIRTQFGTKNGETYVGNIYASAYATEFYMNGINNTPTNISTKWTDFESAPFDIAGSVMSITLYIKASDDLSMWIDNVELVPVEGSYSANGYVDVTFDENSGKYTVTATADDGYVVNDVKVTMRVSGTFTPLTLTPDANNTDSVKAFTFDRPTGGFVGSYDNHRFIVASFGHPAVEYDNVVDNSFEGTWGGATAISGTAAPDSTVAYHGAKSLKITNTRGDDKEGGANKTITVNTADLDVNVKYQLRAQIKGDGNAKTWIYFTADSYFGGKRLNVRNCQGNNINSNTFVLNGVNNNTELCPTEWTQIISEPFTVIGETMNLVLYLRTFVNGSSFWIDNLEVVPVTESSANHGSVKATYDETNNKIIFTAYADAGYKLNTFVSKFFNYSNQNVTSETPICAMPAVNQVSYTCDFNGTLDLGSTTNLGRLLQGAGYELVKATFVQTQVTLNGDVNNDSKVDLLDLVRAKRYFAGLTCDINLVNLIGNTTDLVPTSNNLVNIVNILLGVDQ